MKLEKRVEQLERQNKLFKKGMAVVAVAGLSLLVMGQARRPRAPAMIKAKMFIVVDNNGKSMVIIGRNPKDGSGTILVKGKNNRIGAMISVDRWGNGVVMALNKQQKRLVRIGGSPSGESGTIFTFNSQGKVQVQMSTSKTGTGMIRAFDGAGQLAHKWPSESQRKIPIKGETMRPSEKKGLPPKVLEFYR